MAETKIIHDFLSLRTPDGGVVMDISTTGIAFPSGYNMKSGGVQLAQIFRKTVTLNNEQIKALPTTPVEIVSAPGTGKFINLLNAIIVNAAEVIYTNVNEKPDGYFALQFLPTDAFISQFGYNNELFTDNTDNAGRAVSLLSPLTYQDADEISMNAPSYYYSNIENQSVGLAVTNPLGNFTGGHANNRLKVKAYYTVEEL